MGVSPRVVHRLRRWPPGSTALRSGRAKELGQGLVDAHAFEFLAPRVLDEPANERALNAKAPVALVHARRLDPKERPLGGMLEHPGASHGLHNAVDAYGRDKQ